jgi:hypothetical protein
MAVVARRRAMAVAAVVVTAMIIATAVVTTVIVPAVVAPVVVTPAHVMTITVTVVPRRLGECRQARAAKGNSSGDAGKSVHGQFLR